jgi:hypothetical protein
VSQASQQSATASRRDRAGYFRVARPGATLGRWKGLPSSSSSMRLPARSLLDGRGPTRSGWTEAPDFGDYLDWDVGARSRTGVPAALFLNGHRQTLDPLGGVPERCPSRRRVRVSCPHCGSPIRLPASRSRVDAGSAWNAESRCRIADRKAKSGPCEAGRFTLRGTRQSETDAPNSVVAVISNART